MSAHIIHNGKILPADQPVLLANNRSYRYGSGLFETMRAHNGIIPLKDLHMARLFRGLRQLQFTLPALLTPERLLEQTTQLLRKQGHQNARIRISFYPGNGGIMEGDKRQAAYIIESWPLEISTELNQNGLQLGIYTGARKSCDALSALKSSSAMIYAQAALQARENKWNDALVLNQYSRIADAAIANVFWFANGHCFTTPISEGPVAGVMRRYLLENNLIHEQVLDPETLGQAEEVFVTNAVRGIQWVSAIEDKRFGPPQQVNRLFQQYIKPLFTPH